MADASLLIQVDADARKVKVLNDELDKLKGKAAGTVAESVRLTNALTSATLAAEKLKTSFMQTSLAEDKDAASKEKVKESATRAKIAEAELTNTLNKGKDAAEKHTMVMQKMAGATEKAAQTTKNSKKDWTDLFSSLLNARTGMDGLVGGMLRLGTGAYLMVRGMQTLLNLVKAVPEALLTAAGSAEKTQIALVALTGSVESGTLAYSQLLKLSRESGISGDAAKDTIVRMRGFGVATNELIPLMQKMTIATRGDSDAMQRLGLVYGQVTQQGRTFGDDLRQIYNTGVPLAGAIAKVLDIPVSRLREAGKEGRITAAVLDEALTELTKQGSLLGNAWEEGMNSAISKTNQLKESWSQLLATTGSGILEFYKPAIEFFKKSVVDINDAMQFEKFRTNLREGKGLMGIDIDSALRGGAAAQASAILNSQIPKTGVAQIGAERAVSDTINANQQLLEAIRQNQKTADGLAALADRQRLLGLGAATPQVMADEAMAAIREREKELKDPKQRLLEGLGDEKEVAKAMVTAIIKLIEEEVARNPASFAGAVGPTGVFGKGAGFTGVQDPRLKPQFDLLKFYTDIADSTKGPKPPKTPQQLFDELLLKYQQTIAGEFATLELDPAYDDKMFEAYETFIKSIEDLILSAKPSASMASWWQNTLAPQAAENLNAPMLGIPKATGPTLMPPGRNPWELIPALPEGESWWAEEEATRLAEMYQAVENLKGALGDLATNAGLDALFAMGELFVNGAAGADDFAAAIGNIGLSLLKQLPQMFLSAGLTILINSMGKDARGWGLIALAAGTSVVSGIASANADRSEKAASGSGVTANALGNIYGSSGLISAFASGGIVSSPTLFNHAGGFGVMGEKGPEAIMPVTRTASGKLGVSAVGGSTSIVVIDQSTRVNGVSATTEETTNSSGGKQIRVVLRDTVRSMIANGELDTQLKTRGVPGFGGVRRS